MRKKLFAVTSHVCTPYSVFVLYVGVHTSYLVIEYPYIETQKLQPWGIFTLPVIFAGKYHDRQKVSFTCRPSLSLSRLCRGGGLVCIAQRSKLP